MDQPDTMRVDRWLWCARLFPSRTRAQALCRDGRLRVDGTPVTRPSHKVQPGAVLTFFRRDHVVAVRIEALATRRGPAAQARTLYTALLP